MYYQQGDVLLKKCKNVKGKKEKHLTLALGEATGHHHTVTKGDAELYNDNGKLYLRVNSDKAELTHQEHNAIKIDRGVYEIGIVREFDYVDMEVRNVQD